MGGSQSRSSSCVSRISERNRSPTYHRIHSSRRMREKQIQWCCWRRQQQQQQQYAVQYNQRRPYIIMAIIVAHSLALISRAIWRQIIDTYLYFYSTHTALRRSVVGRDYFGMFVICFSGYSMSLRDETTKCVRIYFRGFTL